MDAALKAIAEPSRRRILTLVKGGERSAGEIASHFAVTRPAISQHLKVLKEAGLVNERRDGVRRLYSVRTEGLGDVRRFVEEFWSEGLVRLKKLAEAEQQDADRLGGTPEQTTADRLGGTPEQTTADRLGGTPEQTTADRLGGTPEQRRRDDDDS